LLKRLTVTILATLLLFSGCTRIIEKPVLVETQCPRLVTIPEVDTLTIVVGEDGKLTQHSLNALVNTSKALRRTEQFYLWQINKYNAKYSYPIDK